MKNLPHRLLRPCVSTLSLLSVLVLGASAFAFDSDNDTLSDDVDAFPCNPSAASVVFSPAQGRFGMMLIEDQWPEQGDLDFNDAVIGYNYIVELNSAGQALSVRATYNLLAIGGVFDNGLGLHLPVGRSQVAGVQLTVGSGPASALTPEADPELTLRLLPNMRALYNNEAGTINSDPSKPTRTAGLPVEVEITFASPQSLDLGQAPFDLYIFRSQRPEHEIHRPEFVGTRAMDQSLFHSADDGSTLSRHFVDRSGLPFALNLPELRPWSQEAVAIHHLYPNILSFAASGGTQAQDFYVNGVDLSFAYGWQPDPERPSVPWNSPIPTAFVGPDDIPAVTGCVNAWGLSVAYGTLRDTFAYDSAIDSSGNLIVTGYSTRSFTGNTNQGLQDIFVAKYTSAGALLWSKQFGGTGADSGRSVAVDSAGNIYVSGETRSASLNAQSAAGQTDAFLLKLNAAGALQWTSLLGGSANDYATGVAVSADGNSIYIAGGSTSSNLPGASYPGNGPTSFLARYNGSGVRQWTQQTRTDPTDPSNFSYASDVALDASGNVLVVGSERRYNRSPSASDNQYVAKYSGTDGSAQWVQHLGDYGYYLSSTDYRFGHALAVAVDSLGAAYVTGTWQAGSAVSSWGGWTRSAGDSSPDVTLVKVDASGNLVSGWTKTLSSSNRQLEYGQSVQVDTAGNAYVAGYTQGTLPSQTSQGGFDYFVTRFNNTGEQAWTLQHGTNSDDGGASVLLTGSSLYVVGNTGNVAAGTPTSYQNTFFGFIAQHNLTTGQQTSFVRTADTPTGNPTGTSCATILASGLSRGDGIYTIDPDGSGPLSPFDTYCDMTSSGGGWTYGAIIRNTTSNGASRRFPGVTVFGSAVANPLSCEYSVNLSGVSFSAILIRNFTTGTVNIQNATQSRVWDATIGQYTYSSDNYFKYYPLNSTFDFRTGYEVNNTPNIPICFGDATRAPYWWACDQDSPCNFIGMADHAGNTCDAGWGTGNRWREPNGACTNYTGSTVVYGFAIR